MERELMVITPEYRYTSYDDEPKMVSPLRTPPSFPDFPDYSSGSGIDSPLRNPDFTPPTSTTSSYIFDKGIGQPDYGLGSIDSPNLSFGRGTEFELHHGVEDNSGEFVYRVVSDVGVEQVELDMSSLQIRDEPVMKPFDFRVIPPDEGTFSITTSVNNWEDTDSVRELGKVEVLDNGVDVLDNGKHKDEKVKRRSSSHSKKKDKRTELLEDEDRRVRRSNSEGKFYRNYFKEEEERVKKTSSSEGTRRRSSSHHSHKDKDSNKEREDKERTKHKKSGESSSSPSSSRSKHKHHSKEPSHKDENFTNVDKKVWNWTKGEKIDSGAFGIVWKALDCDTGAFFAVKEVNADINDEKKAKEALMEIEILKKLDHPNIVRYLGSEIREHTLYVYLELATSGSLSSMLRKFGPLPENVVRVYTKQALAGLQYLHENGVIHRDIKGGNILVYAGGVIKLSDFGCAKIFEGLRIFTSNCKSIVGTPFWMPPELLLGKTYGRSVDIWSLGCTIIEMATAKPPWFEEFPDPTAAMYHIGSSQDIPKFPKDLSEDASDFLLSCLKRDPKERATVATLIQHPFVNPI